jgi:hypothetical protein
MLHQGAQVALLKVTATLSIANTVAAVKQATDANAEMASAPIDPIALISRLPPIQQASSIFGAYSSASMGS